MKSKFRSYSHSITLAASLATVTWFAFLLSVAQAAPPTDNIALGSGAGSAVTPNADNIDIGHPGGGPSETKTIRIGTQGTQKATYIAGIHSIGIAPTLTPLMVVIGSNGQLGTATAPAASDENRNLSGTTGNSAAEGVQALNPANTGNNNTATGWNALIKNTSGGSNTANGTFALANNTVGSGNTANGEETLRNNTTSSANTATGYQALFKNSTSATTADNGAGNTATGHQAMLNNTFGYDNTATGRNALLSNTTGLDNTVAGNEALYKNTTGSFNIALGYRAGETLSSGNNNIYIGNPGPNPAGALVAAESGKIRIGTTGTGQQQQNATYIAAIYQKPVTNSPLPVFIDADGRLGSPSSSQRFKKEIKPMNQSSEAILALKPVTFQYKSDSNEAPQFGLIAEEVAQVNPDLVVRDEKGEVYTVRYDAINAMLLNEFQKEHRKVQEQETMIAQLKASIAQQEKGMEVLAASLKKQAAQIAKVSTQIEATKSGARLVDNRP